MNPRSREVETITLAMFAALPLYGTYAVSPLSVLLFHFAMTALAIRVALRGTDFGSIREGVQIAGAAYLLFFPLDAIFLSKSLIRASGHLIFFIIIFQTVESSWRKNERQRFLTTFLLFVTSVATATHMTIVLYVAGFAFLCYRQLIHLSHERMSEQLGINPSALPASRAAFSYVLPTILIAGLLFPVLPRVRSPFVSGFAGNLAQATSGISDSIDFSQTRTISPDPEVVARVWMARDAVAFFAPVRLRVRTYERFDGREWKAAQRLRLKWSDGQQGRFAVARPEGFSRRVIVQQKSTREAWRSAYTRLFLPVGTHTVSGIPSMLSDASANVFMTPADPRGSVTYRANLSRQTLPIQAESPIPIQYPIQPEIRQFAREVIGNANTLPQVAAKIETHLSTRFRYLADPAELKNPISVEQFLLRERRGHCEYFAAGMVVLLTALDVPARIVGGYYGGDYNPLTGYFVIRQRDAHAWVEMWDGKKWVTYDPTPPTLRPGSASRGLFRAYLNALTDSVNYFWDRYILTYSLGDQITLFQEAFWRARRARDQARDGLSKITDWLLNPILLVAIVVASLAVIVVLRFPRRRSMFEQLQARLARLGISVDDSMTAYEVLEKVRAERPDLAGPVASVVDVYVRDRFSPTVADAHARTAALRTVATLR